MAFCGKCGKQIEEGINFCPYCGAKPDGSDADNQKTPQQTIENIMDTPDTTAEFNADDIASNKGMAVLAYFGLLVLIPIFAAKQSKFARFHSNQGLVLWVASLIWSMATSFAGAIPFVGDILAGVMGLISIVWFVLTVIGIVNAVQGKAKQLPIIGKFELLK